MQANKIIKIYFQPKFTLLNYHVRLIICAGYYHKYSRFISAYTFTSTNNDKQTQVRISFVLVFYLINCFLSVFTMNIRIKLFLANNDWCNTGLTHQLWSSYRHQHTHFSTSNTIQAIFCSI